MKSKKIGDVLEIPVSGGCAYALYTHKHPEYGDLLRVFSGIYRTRPDLIDLVSRGEIIFSCFTPLGRFLKHGFGRVVDSVEVPYSLSSFPIFKTGLEDPTTKEVGTWWLWDGVGEWKVGDLSEDQMNYPNRGVWGAELVVRRIEDGWSQSS